MYAEEFFGDGDPSELPFFESTHPSALSPDALLDIPTIRYSLSKQFDDDIAATATTKYSVYHGEGDWKNTNTAHSVTDSGERKNMNTVHPVNDGGERKNKNSVHSVTDGGERKKIRDTACAVCFVEYTKGESVKLLPCQHVFHPHCIGPWLCRNAIWCVTYRFVLHRSLSLRSVHSVSFLLHILFDL
jgi:hypothetical protein